MYEDVTKYRNELEWTPWIIGSMLVTVIALYISIQFLGPQQIETKIAATCVHPSGGPKIDAVATRVQTVPGPKWGGHYDRIKTYSFVRNNAIVHLDTTSFDDSAFASWDYSPNDPAIDASTQLSARENLFKEVTSTPAS